MLWQARQSVSNSCSLSEHLGSFSQTPCISHPLKSPGHLLFCQSYSADTIHLVCSEWKNILQWFFDVCGQFKVTPILNMNEWRKEGGQCHGSEKIHQFPSCHYMLKLLVPSPIVPSQAECMLAFCWCWTFFCKIHHQVSLSDAGCRKVLTGVQSKTLMSKKCLVLILHPLIYLVWGSITVSRNNIATLYD